jgi:hypothetical protein
MRTLLWSLLVAGTLLTILTGTLLWLARSRSARADELAADMEELLYDARNPLSTTADASKSQVDEALDAIQVELTKTKLFAGCGAVAGLLCILCFGTLICLWDRMPAAKPQAEGT